ncbi:MAG: crossover junction endodeoxyribonuclease RuvC [Halobacteriovoraceae bacterium]|nr:crossover junction endodeoxyribonuclease RuvC [Halobacteriovoraceae bacterium]
MKILGIDPGSLKMGYAIIKSECRIVRYINSGVQKFPKKQNIAERLPIIFDFCMKLEKIYKPDAVSIESLVFIKNPNSLAKLAQARGAILAAFPGVQVFEYSPNLVKSSVSGHGHATKESVEKSLRLIFPKDLQNYKFQTDDESDALSIALCHALHLKSQSNKRPLNTGSRSLASSLAHKI